MTGKQLEGMPSSSPSKVTSNEDVFGGSRLSKGTSSVKYGSKHKAGNGHRTPGSSPSRPNSSNALRIDLSDALSTTPSRKRRRPVSDTFDDDSDPELSPLPPLTPTPRVKQAKGSKIVSSSDSSNLGELWNIDSLGEYVWVLVNQKGRAFESDAGIDAEYMWWPAKVTKLSSNGVSVCPYGALASTVLVKGPSADNILSLTDRIGRPRFESLSFHTSEPVSSAMGSPRKKQKRSAHTMESKWQAAVGEMYKEKEDQDDGLPPIEFALSASSRFASANVTPKRKGKAKTKTKTPVSEEEDQLEEEEYRLTLDDDWTPPDADEMLSIPGELVLARTRADKNIQHWPAKVLEYIPPPKPIGKRRPKEPLYKIIFLDDMEQNVPRAWFYACHEDEFGTCAVGKFASQYIDNPEDGHDEDAKDRAEPSQHQDTATPRTPSPVPLSSLPSSFTDLSVHAQFSYLKPVLCAILNDQYAPAQGRHDDFMKGGRARAGLTASGGLRGTVSPSDVDRLSTHLSNWCLRDEIRAQMPVPDEDLQNAIQEGRQPLDHIDNNPATASSMGAISSDESREAAKENVSPRNTKFMHHKESSPALTDSDELPPSRPSLPPTSSFSLLSHDGELPVDDSDVEIQNAEANDTVSAENPGDASANATPKTTTSRQKGCEAYEALAGLEKIAYCTNVLLPEAVFQLLLWRNGLRSSTELLSQAEESELHEKAKELAEETDWVFDVVRLRETKVRQLNRSKAVGNAGPGGTSRTRSRSARRR